MDLTQWQFIVVIISAICGLLGLIWSAVNFAIGKYVAGKITNNDLKHLTIDVNNLKIQGTKIKDNIERKLDQIFKRLGKIDKAIVKRDTLCNERHKR